MKNKVALITGAGSGIGKATAIEFSKAGATVIVTDINKQSGEQTAKEILNAGGQSIAIQMDVTSSQSIQQAIEKVISVFGRLDCAFNNAGFAGDNLVDTAEHSEENWDIVTNINLKGVWLCMKYEIPKILASGGGTIINNSSIFGLIASSFGHAPYCASKHGVIALTKTAAYEYADRGLRINAICPGTVSTEGIRRGMSKNPTFFQETLLNKIPMKRFGTPSEVARVVLWLASDQSSYITGQSVGVDGGFLL